MKRSLSKLFLFFSLFNSMGQYFKAVNLDKKEYVCPWCIGGGAKLWEWAVNPPGAIFTLLLRKSSEGGGGDFFGYSKGYDEGSPVPDDFIAGRWAGDRIWLAGDYDESRIWDGLGGGVPKQTSRVFGKLAGKETGS